MKVKTELRAGSDTAVAVGSAAIAANLSRVVAVNRSSISGNGANLVAQENYVSVTQTASATSTNSGAVTASTT
jgi:hypothetical protein